MDKPIPAAAPTTTNYKLLFKGIGALSFLYLLSYLSATAFFFGLIASLPVQLLMLWLFLGRYSNKYERNLKIEFAKIDSKIINEGQEIHPILQKPPGQKRKKRPFYENTFHKFYEEEPLGEQLNEDPFADPLKKSSPINNMPPERQTVNPLTNFNVADIHDMIKNRLTYTGKDPMSDLKKSARMNLVALSSTETMDEIKSFTLLIKQFAKGENTYGDGLEFFGKSPGNIFSASSDVLFTKDAPQAFQIETKELAEYELSTLKKRFGEAFVAKTVLDLPEWKTIKAATNAAGTICKNCSVYIEESAIETLNTLGKEYLQDYEEMNKTRDSVKEEFEKAVQYQKKVTNEYEALEKQLDESLLSYHELTKKKESPSTLLKAEMKIRLLKQDLDGFRAKLADAKTRVQEQSENIKEANIKIKTFKKHWKKQLHSVFLNALRSSISIIEEHYSDIDQAYASLLNPKNKLKLDLNEPIPEEADESNAIGDEDPVSVKTLRYTSVTEFTNTNNMRKISMSESVGRSWSRTSQDSKSRFSMATDRTVPKPKVDVNAFVFLQEKAKLLVERSNKKVTDLQERIKDVQNLNKEIIEGLKTLIDIEEGCFKENENILNNEFSPKGHDEFQKQWKTYQNSVFNISCKRKKLIANLRECLQDQQDIARSFDKEPRRAEAMLVQINKRFAPMIKTLEKEVARIKSKDEFSFAKLFNREEKETAFIDEGSVEYEIEFYKKDIGQCIEIYEQFLKKIIKAEGRVKKTTLLSYFDTFDSIKDMISKLTSEAETNMFEMTRSVSLAPAETDRTQEEDTRNSIRKNMKLHSQALGMAQAMYLNVKQMPPGDPDQKPYAVKDFEWFNKLLNIFAMEWSSAQFFKFKIKKILTKVLNKKRTKYLTEIIVKDFTLEPHFPDVRSITVLPSDEYEFLCDIDLAYRGLVTLELETYLLLSIISSEPIPLKAKIAMKTFNGKIRVCFVPFDYGKSWLQFIGDPRLGFEIDPVIGTSKYSINKIPQVSTILTDLVESQLRKMTYPHKTEIDIPLAFKD